MSQDLIKVQTQNFSHDELFKWLQQGEASNGAIVTFTGLVRDSFQNDLKFMFLEHYPGMTEKCLTNIVHQARARWPLDNVAVIHRVGRLHVDENIVFVGVVSAHRVAAFEASQFIMDYLKKEAPFWKKEAVESQESWVEQKQSDLEAAKKW